jgi:OFA family oxalate/formate antiporter-like MFS transporter
MCHKQTNPRSRSAVNRIIGILYSSVAFGTLIGPTAAGVTFSESHSYTMPVLASVCANLTAASRSQ